ncbi:MAG: HNH endonuclease signature motif containing protein [Myxococcota bacterium]
MRDGGCRFPGCANRRWLDAHHIEHWVDGGRTARDNLVLLCSEHHRLVHEGGFRIERRGGELAFVRPDGVTLAAPPVPFVALVKTVAAPRPPCSEPPDYSMAVGILTRCAA